MLKLPYGVNNFEKVISENYYFIDKSKYIEIIENEQAPYLVLLRPRRFGKSLFLDMMYKYYDIMYKDKFDKLFSKLYIGKHKSKLANSYLVIKFDFSGITTGSRDINLIEKKFNENVKKTIINFYKEHKLVIDFDPEGLSAAELLLSMILSLSNVGIRVYVLIDEYDHFSNQLLAYSVSGFKDVVSRDGYFRSFFEVLKRGTGSIIDRIFITGVTPITLDSLTSGFNISLNRSLDYYYNEMLGFSQSELDELLEKLKYHCKFSEKEIESLREELKFYYNGYIFTGELDAEVNRLYNPDMVLYNLSEYVRRCKGPRNMIDVNISSDYSKLRRLIELGGKNRSYKIIERLLKEKFVNSMLSYQFNLEIEIKEKEIISLLYYLGLLTISGSMGNFYTFSCPNYVIEDLYYEYLSYILSKDVNQLLDIENLREVMYKFSYEGEYIYIIDYVSNILKVLSNRDYIKFDERYIKLIYIMLFRLSGIYKVKSEYEISGRYIDILLEGREIYSVKNNYVLEFKYIKKSEYREDLLSKKELEGINQLKEYRKKLEREGYIGYRYILLIYSGNECKLVREV